MTNKCFSLHRKISHPFSHRGLNTHCAWRRQSVILFSWHNPDWFVQQIKTGSTSALLLRGGWNIILPFIRQQCNIMALECAGGKGPHLKCLWHTVLWKKPDVKKRATRETEIIRMPDYPCALVLTRSNEGSCFGELVWLCLLSLCISKLYITQLSVPYAMLPSYSQAWASQFPCRRYCLSFCEKETFRVGAGRGEVISTDCTLCFASWGFTGRLCASMN